MKERFSKQYRHADLDAKLSTARMTAEVRAMAKSRRQAGLADSIYTPTVFHVDEEQRRIYMERIMGHTVKDKMYTLKLDQEEGETGERKCRRVRCAFDALQLSSRCLLCGVGPQTRRLALLSLQRSARESRESIQQGQPAPATRTAEQSSIIVLLCSSRSRILFCVPRLCVARCCC